MASAEQLNNRTEKNSHWRFPIKNAVLKNFVIMRKQLRDIFQSNYFEEHCVRLLLSGLYELIA